MADRIEKAPSEAREVQAKVPTLPESVPDAYAMLLALQHKQKITEKRIKSLKGYMQSQITVTGEDEEGRPQGAAFGIVMTIFSRRSVSWAKVVDEAKRDIIPKSRLAELEGIVEGKTKVTSYPGFQEEEEDDGFGQP